MAGHTPRPPPMEPEIEAFKREVARLENNERILRTEYDKLRAYADGLALQLEMLGASGGAALPPEAMPHG